MNATNLSSTPTSDRRLDQLYAPNGRRIAASKDWIPGNALIASATRAPDGTLEIEWEGETKLCWDGQYTEQLGERRIFLDDANNEWCEDQVALGATPVPVAAVPTPTTGENAWTAIPHHSLGQVPESLADENPMLYRQVIAKRALLAAYENGDDPEAAIADLLADLRHHCDGLRLDFAELDRAAYRHYAEEKVSAAGISASTDGKNLKGDGEIERERLLRIWRLNPEAEVDLCTEADVGGGIVRLSDKAGNQIDEFQFGSADEADRAVDYALKEMEA